MICSIIVYFILMNCSKVYKGKQTGHSHNVTISLLSATIKGCSRNYPGGVQALFCLVGGGCFVDVSEGWGGNLSWGSRRI